MLTEQHGLRLDDGTETIITVDEILEMYEIKGLTLEELQEKYVDLYDQKSEELSELNEKYEDLNNSFSSLEETIKEKIDELNMSTEDNSNDYTSYSDDDIHLTNSSFFIILVVVFIIAYVIGTKKNK